MHLPARYAPVLFGALLSAIMVVIVSGFVLMTTQSIDADLPTKWLKSCATTWPVAFIAVTLIAPWVRKAVGRLTRSPLT